MRFLDWLFEGVFGCSHSRVTRPIGTLANMYVVCLDCGKELAYDWGQMRVMGDK